MRENSKITSPWRGDFGIFPHFALGSEVARIVELEAQYGLTKNTAAAMKAAGVPGGLAYISVPHVERLCKLVLLERLQLS
jgi:hypothetical protein